MTIRSVPQSLAAALDDVCCTPGQFAVPLNSVRPVPRVPRHHNHNKSDDDSQRAPIDP